MTINMTANPQSIKVYCRIRPLKKNERSVKYDIINDVIPGIDVLDLKHQTSRNNHHNKYQYHRIFNENISQSLIFDIVAVPILDKFVSGMNCTIFTYGQTCSGKTYTMYGSKEDQGIIPRTLEYLFKSTEVIDLDYKVTLQYIEIYNEEVYDLLSLPNKKYILLNKINKNIKFDNKVKFSINQNGEIDFKNLNSIKIINASDALKNIELGNAKRSISSTSMNFQSSRSHCICIITMSNEENNIKGTKMKLNLVDLAGSERISRSENNEKTLIESRSINSSLHHLNHVINMLANPKIHVPYRNSTMTSVLRGSLGTECATAMIATLVLNNQCISESMSTCRFSKAVSAIKQFVNKTLNTKSPNKLLLLKNKLKMLEIQKVTWEEENESLKKENNKLKNVLSNENENDQERLSENFLCKMIEDKIELENIKTNTKNNEDLMITSIENHEELHEELKVDGIVENLTSDHSGNELEPNFEIADGNNNVSVVHVMAPYIMHCDVRTDDNTITQSKTIDNNMVMILGKLEIYRLANMFLKHFKLIVLIITIISMFKPQRLIWNNELDAETVKVDSAILNTLKYLKPELSMNSIVPEWLKSHWDPVRLCPDGGNLQTHCCCGQCLWICIKPINDRTNEKVVSSFCDCHQAPSVMESLNTENDHRLIKGLSWLNEMFEKHLTLKNLVFKRGIYLLSYTFVIIVTVMMLFKLFRLKLINKSYSYNVNLDSSSINTQNTIQPNSITIHVVPEELQEQCTHEQLQHPRFIVKIDKDVTNNMNIVQEKTAEVDKIPIKGNNDSNSQNGFKRYGFRRWS